MKTMDNQVYSSNQPYLRYFSKGYGKGYTTRVALCSRCHQSSAYWYQAKGNRTRYYCHECVKVTAAWKKQFAKPKGTEP